MNFQASEQQPVDRVVAIVLGGGRGTRLFPLTKERAKPAVPVAGRYRLVDIPLSNCINSGINRVFVLTQFNSRSLHRHINEAYKFDAFSRGFVEILAAEQTPERGDWFQGTADAIRQNLWHLRDIEADHVLILSGDHLYRMDYRAFLAHHLRARADITVSTVPVTREEAKDFGIMQVDVENQIHRFVEKPDTEEKLANLATPRQVLSDFGLENPAGREYLASMGVYLFRRHILAALLEDHREWIDFGRQVIPGSLETHRVYSYLFTGFWEDIGTVRSYYDVSMRLAGPDSPFRFVAPEGPIYSRARYLPGSRIRNAVITDSIVCEGSSVYSARVSHSIIGIRSVLREGAEVHRSVLMGADYFEHGPIREGIPLGIGAGSVIERAIIDKNARIGKNVVIRGGPELEGRIAQHYAVVEGIVVVLKNALIPDGTVIGQATA